MDSLNNVAHAFAHAWYDRPDDDRNVLILAYKIHVLLCEVCEHTTTQERDRIGKKLAKLVNP